MPGGSIERFIDGAERGQSTLLPACLNDRVGENNQVRVIDIFVDGLDLCDLGFEGVEPSSIGRLAHHPSFLLKLYGYLNRVRSSRRRAAGSEGSNAGQQLRNGRMSAAMTQHASTSQGAGPPASRHIPVMLTEVLAALKPADGEFYVDGTFGAGGYTSAILAAADCRVLALDRDIHAVRDAETVCALFPKRLTVVEASFSSLDEVARAQMDRVDGVVLDIGVSSMQLDDPLRGFSFQTDGPLDMRMAAHGPTAADVVNTMDEEPLANILFELGEEKRSRAIARAIVQDRGATPFTTTLQLARLISRVMGGRREDGRHPATRSFQALRIYVNDELGELKSGLAAAERILKPGGRLVVISFHSLEDRIVKQFFIERSGRRSAGSRHLPPVAENNSAPSFRCVNQRPFTPSQPELDVNPRARSARLRFGIKT